jgi:hypothetical protein
MFRQISIFTLSAVWFPWCPLTPRVVVEVDNRTDNRLVNVCILGSQIRECLGDVNAHSAGSVQVKPVTDSDLAIEFTELRTGLRCSRGLNVYIERGYLGSVYLRVEGCSQVAVTTHVIPL